MPRGQTTFERFWTKVYFTERCWLWKSTLNSTGYGLFSVGEDGQNRQVLAHIFSCDNLVGKLPAGFEHDHTCQTVNCVNPDCIDFVTHSENQRRMSLRITHCPYGHPYTNENTYITRLGGKSCKECSRIRVRLRRANAKQPDSMYIVS